MAKARKKWIVGVDLGGTNIVVGLLPIDGGDVLGLRILPTESHKGPKFVVNRIVEMVEAAIAEVLAEHWGGPGPDRRGRHRIARSARYQGRRGHQHAEPGVAQFPSP